MEIRDINEIKLAIKYMDFKPNLLSKFYDVKALLFSEIVENEEYYKVESIMPNPLNDNKIVKCVNILDAKYTKTKEKIDCIKGDFSLPKAAKEIMDNISIYTKGGSVFLKCGVDFLADIYINLPRENSTTIKNVNINKEMEFEIVNVFNAYASEGFTLAFRGETFSIAIEPSALEGIKGQGDVFVYVMDENAIYKDEASKYFDCKDILKIYKGWL